MDIFLNTLWITVNCSVPYHCPEEPLQLIISVLGETRLLSQEMIYDVIEDGKIQTAMSFDATWKDHGKTVVCSLKKQNGLEISKSTKRLDVKREFCVRRDLGTEGGERP